MIIPALFHCSRETTGPFSYSIGTWDWLKDFCLRLSRLASILLHSVPFLLGLLGQFFQHFVGLFRCNGRNRTVEQEGQQLFLFLVGTVFMENFFLGPVDESIPGVFIEAVVTGKNGTDLLIGVVGIFFQDKDDLVLPCFLQLPMAGGADFSCGGQRAPQMAQAW